MMIRNNKLFKEAIIMNSQILLATKESTHEIH